MEDGSMEEEGDMPLQPPLPGVATDQLAGSHTSSNHGSTTIQRVRSRPTMRLRRKVGSLTEPAEPPFFLESEDNYERSCWSLKDMAEAYFRSFWAQFYMFSLSILACVLYVVETYQESPYDDLILTVMEIILSLSFLVDYILTLAFALDRWRYIVSFDGIIDLVSILPLISLLIYRFSYGEMHNAAVTWLEIGSLCRILRGLKIFRVMRFSEPSSNMKMPYSLERDFSGPLPFDEGNTVRTRIITLCFWLCGTIFISTGLVFFIDTHEKHKSFSLPPDMKVFTWMDALYFVSVTLATVGYGDITPASNLSRIVVLLAIFFFLCCIPYQIGRLMEAITSKSIYRTAVFRPVRNTEHAVLLGRVTYPVLASFIEQFLHGDKVLEHNFRLVILSPKEPDAWLRTLLQHPRYQDRVQYLHGSPWSAQDLRRAGVGHAQAIFILADFFANDIAKDQDRILLTAVTARKYLIRQNDATIDQDSDDDEEGEETNAPRKVSSSCGIISFDRPKEKVGAEMPSLARLKSTDAAGSYSYASCSSPPPKRQASLDADDSELPSSFLRHKSLPLLTRKPLNTYVRGAVSVLQRGISSLGSGVGQRRQQEADEELSERIVIQTHTTAAMEELTQGLGFRQAYCPHVIRLRLMAYGTVFPGLVSFFMNLLKGDPFRGDDVGHQPEWFRAFREGARQRVVRHQVLLPPDSPLKGRTFAEVARYLYRMFGIIMVGVDVNGVFLLNPHDNFRFQPNRARTVMAYFIALSKQRVREALEMLQHVHWDRMGLAASLDELPRVGLHVGDLPLPRTTLLESMQSRPSLHMHRISFGVGRGRTGVPYRSFGRTDSELGGVSGRSVDGDPVDPNSRRASIPTHRQVKLHQEIRNQHQEMLTKAHRTLWEAYEDNQKYSRGPDSSMQQRYEVSTRRNPANVSASGGMVVATTPVEVDRRAGKSVVRRGGKEVDEAMLGLQESSARDGLSIPPPSPPQQQQHSQSLRRTQLLPIFLESVVEKVQGARDMLTQLLDVHHSPLPEGGLHDHVVLGICNHDAPSMDSFIQYVSAFRKLLHLPIVVLCADSERFANMLQGIRQRLRQSVRPVADLKAPDTHDIFFIKGSPKKKQDLRKCCVESAYAVVLLGDDVPRRREADGEGDPVLMDRHVLLSCFKLESILRQRLYSQVLTLVDLRSAQNMHLLRQRVRAPSQLSASSTITPGFYLGRGSFHIPGSKRSSLNFGGSGGEEAHRSLSMPPDNPPVLKDHTRVSFAALAGEACTSDNHQGLAHGSDFLHQDVHPHNDPHHHHHYDEEDPCARRRRRRAFSAVPERAFRPEQGCPLFAAGRVCCRSFFDVFFIYLYKSPHTLKFWKEMTRSRRDDLAGEEFQMGNGMTVAEMGFEDSEIMEEMMAEGLVGEEGEEGERGAEIPMAYNGRQLFMDTTGSSEAPPGMVDLQDSIDALRSSLDEMALPRAFIGARYGDLVDSLLHIGLVPMGLYRPRGLLDAPMPFSVVNPPPDTKVVRADLIFVLRPAAVFDAKGKGGGGMEGPAYTPGMGDESSTSGSFAHPLAPPIPPVQVRRRSDSV